jgi:dextranase
MIEHCKNMYKMNLLIAGLALLSAACSDGNTTPGNEPAPTPGGGPSGGVSDVTDINSNLSIDLVTDKACYRPGETVRFTASGLHAGAKVRYRHGAEVEKEENLTVTQWEWTPAGADFTGYMVEIYQPGDNHSETILGTIAVDVSSDWTRFPRYGFVATFDESKLADGVIEREMDFLNRCHINGVQFQDWHNKHHWPLGGTRDNLLEVYKDIANRDVYTAVVKKYIDVQHSLGMKSMFYNLCFGALDDAAADGVKEQWYAFRNDRRGDKDYHSLPGSWKSNIFLLDPANKEWQEYIGDRNDDVYANFDFDGYQIDQLGGRADLYDYDGNRINLPKGYASFIDAMKTRHPSKRLVMNAVSSYGASQIAGSGKVDFCYNEVWNDEPEFADLHKIIKANDSYSSNSLRTVFAAYMNYDKAGSSTGEFNTPGVLMADAVMMALGGSHLELGDHMLSREYFPATPLEMSEELRTAMIRYYDFMTAYQNLLRGTSTQTEFQADMSCPDPSKKITVAAWPPKKGNITTYAKKVGDADVIHLLNFLNIDNLSWRDLQGKRTAPRLTRELPLSINYSKKVNRIWTASPDYHGGAVVELPFSQTDGKVTFILPSLKYWSMIVIE